MQVNMQCYEIFSLMGHFLAFAQIWMQYAWLGCLLTKACLGQLHKLPWCRAGGVRPSCCQNKKAWTFKLAGRQAVCMHRKSKMTQQAGRTNNVPERQCGQTTLLLNKAPSPARKLVVSIVFARAKPAMPHQAYSICSIPCMHPAVSVIAALHD